MLRKLLFGLIITLFISCGTDHTDFSGNWIDKKNESDKMIINKNGDNYIVENREKKYPAQIKDGLLEISTELPLKATIDDNDILIINGKEYIRFEKATKPKFLGKWKSVYTENPSTKEKMKIEFSDFITIVDKNGYLSISFEGHPEYPQKYSNIKYNNGIIKYNLRYRQETGWERKNNMEFTLLDEDKIVTGHNFTSENVIFEKVN